MSDMLDAIRGAVGTDAQPEAAAPNNKIAAKAIYAARKKGMPPPAAAKAEDDAAAKQPPGFPEAGSVYARRKRQIEEREEQSNDRT